jgi:hypothetical protein
MVRMDASLTGTNQVRVTWRAITASHVNIKDYCLQYCAQGPVPGQVDDEPWTDLVTNSPDTEYVFSGTPGTTYTFRCSGTDYVRGTSAFMESAPVEIPAEDSDKDGLPDWWETYYFTQEDAMPADDPDHDGASNLNEFVADTHPREAHDCLRVTECQLSREGDATIATVSWTSKATCSYALLWATNLIQPAWEETGLGLISPDGTVTRRRVECPGDTQRFFRVEVRKVSRN